MERREDSRRESTTRSRLSFFTLFGGWDWELDLRRQLWTADSSLSTAVCLMPHAACRMRDPVLTSCTAKITQLPQRVVVVRERVGAQLPACAWRALHHHVASLSPHAKKCARVLGIIKLIVLISVRLRFLLSLSLLPLPFSLSDHLICFD